MFILGYMYNNCPNNKTSRIISQESTRNHNQANNFDQFNGDVPKNNLIPISQCHTFVYFYKVAR